MTSQALYLGFLGLLAVERLYELRLSRRNAAWALAQGGVEVGRAHYRAMVALHTGFLIACGVEVVFGHRPFAGLFGWIAIGGAVLSQGLRYWAIHSLGPRWNTRIIVLPQVKPVTSGPYRYLRHPNYVAVIAEGLFVPLMHNAWATALAFTLGNAMILSVRIRMEEKALGHSYQAAFADKPRFFPDVQGRHDH